MILLLSSCGSQIDCGKVATAANKCFPWMNTISLKESCENNVCYRPKFWDCYIYCSQYSLEENVKCLGENALCSD